MDQDLHVRLRCKFLSQFGVTIRIQLLAGSPPFATPSAVHLFEASLSHLWSIWECLVLCEPILFFGQSPAWTSKAIWWMRDVFRPVRTFFVPYTLDVDRRHVTQIPWAGDFRPYFTIHDREHSALVNDRRPKAGLLLGVTNPFYEKACSHWPHVLTLGGKSRRVVSVHHTPSRHSDRCRSRQGPSTRFAGLEPGWKTKTHKRYTSKDRQLLQQLEAVAGGGNAKACGYSIHEFFVDD